MDIRKYFSPPGKEKSSKKLSSSKSKKTVIFDDSDDDETPFKPKSKKVQEKLKKAEKSITPESFFNKKIVKKEKRLQKRKASDDAEKATPSKRKTQEDVPLPKRIVIDDDLDFDGSLDLFEVKEKKPKTAKRNILGNGDVKKSSKQKLKKEKSKEKLVRDKPSEEPPSKRVTRSTPQKERPVKNEDSIKTESDIKIKQNRKVNSEVKLPKKKTPVKTNTAEEVKMESKTPPTKLKKETPKKPSKEPIKDEEVVNAAKKEQFKTYQMWKNRPTAIAHGSKEIPVGADNCLEGLTFVITGVLESLERDEAKSLIERYSGRVTGSVSGRTTYVVVGDEPGESKIEKAKKLKVKEIDEDGLLDLIRTKPAKKSKYDIAAEKEAAAQAKVDAKKKISEVKQKNSKSTNSMKQVNKNNSQDSTKSNENSSANSEQSLMFVDKYKPKNIKQIIGQQGAKSNASKLLQWLQDWHMNNLHAGVAKPRPKTSQWGGGDPTGASCKAALLSGPPGVGKTTTATIVCQEAGFSFIELNASDTRSKRTLKEEVAATSGNLSIASMTENGHCRSNHHVIIMDEVDGMSGNEDRGGMQELVQIIKQTKIPIICMCNDRTSPKMRTLTNYCFDLRFYRPRVEQITGAMMSVCFKEGITIPAPAVQSLVQGCNQDVRQVLHNLSMLKSDHSSDSAISYDDVKKYTENVKKDVSLGIFDIAKKLLTNESGNFNINQKLDLFFMDYSMMPLFVQDNYPHITPASAKGNIFKTLDALSKSADMIVQGDMVDAKIRTDQSWSALPTYGLLSTVLPCDVMRGHMGGMINFPAFFGKLSTTGKNRHIIQELKFHSSIATSGVCENNFISDYVTYLRWHLSRPLVEQSQTGENQIEKTTAMLDAYDLTKDDFDSVVEVGQFPGRPPPMAKVETKVKSAFTRTYNKESHLTPYAVLSTAAVKKKRKAAGVLEEDGNDEAADDDDDITMDGMIKVKPAGRKKAAQDKSKKKTIKSRKK